LCTEISHVTDHASAGPNPEFEKQLQLTSASMTKGKMDGFSYSVLEKEYSVALHHLQSLLMALTDQCHLWSKET
jgi:hypothetical protein